MASIGAGVYLNSVRESLYPVLDYGADPTGSLDSADAIQAAINAGQPVDLPPGRFMVERPVLLASGVPIDGAGRGQTTIFAGPSLTAAGGAVLQKVSASASDSVQSITISNLTIDATAGPGGTVDGIYLDTSISSAVVYNGVTMRGVTVQNARTGFRWDGNNASAGPRNNELWAVNCRADNCAIGFGATGTYAASYSRCFATRSTMAGWGTGGVSPGFTWFTGQGPTTLTRIGQCHVEGLGNISGAGTETDHGIYVASSDLKIKDVIVSNVSRFAVVASSGEGYAALVDGVTVWGAGFSGLYLTGGAGQNGVCSNVSLYNVAQSSQANPAEQCAVLHGSGNWIVQDIEIPTASEAPPYAIGWGSDVNDGYTQLSFTRVNCPAPKTAHTYQLSNPQTGTLRFDQCVGINPAAGTSPVTGQGITPAIPAASTTVTNTSGVDVDVYIAGGAAVAVTANGVATGQAAGTFFVPAGGTIDLGAYTTAPTWVWVGR